MTLNWSTLVLEIINFLVLLWLLQRFLYRPVQRLLVQRQAEIEHKLIQAEQRQQQAEGLHKEYQQQINDWQQQQQQAKAQLQVELEAHRKESLEQLQLNLQAVREKEQVVIARQREQQRQHDQQQALSNGCSFASRLLQYCSGPELEPRLIELFVEELDAAPVALRQALRSESINEMSVETTQGLSPGTLDVLQQQIETLLQADIRCVDRINPDLIAGIRMTLGGRVLGANIQDELQAFADIRPPQDR